MNANQAPWRLVGVLVAVGAAGVLRWGSLVPVASADADKAQIRLSWSARPERVEQCRRLSDDELLKLPPHMRLRVQCEGSFARYLLTVRVNAAVLSQDTLRGGGLRHDRPIHVYEEVPVAAGHVRVQLDVARLDSAVASTGAPEAGATSDADTLLGNRASREVDERQRRAREAMPAHLAIDTSLTLTAGKVVLVVYDEPSRKLTILAGTGR
ncbi:MAG: hypothetical protein U0132_19070 [Gemmatimonadaceae bacterium]